MCDIDRNKFFDEAAELYEAADFPNDEEDIKERRMMLLNLVIRGG